MVDNESQLSTYAETSVHDAIPLARGQRAAAAVIGTVLTGGGAASAGVSDRTPGTDALKTPGTTRKLC